MLLAFYLASRVASCLSLIRIQLRPRACGLHAYTPVPDGVSKCSAVAGAGGSRHREEP